MGGIMKQFSILLLVLCSSSFGFELFYTTDGKPLKWGSPEIYYKFEGHVPRFIKKSFEDQMRKWEAATSGTITFKKAKKRNQVTWFGGGGIRIIYSRRGWIDDQNTLGYAVYNNNFTPIAGVTLVINGRSFKWHRGNPFFDPEKKKGKRGADIDRVALHEIGHALGLNHSPDKDSVMSIPLHESQDVLSGDDIVGIQTLYPN
jgi:hypothetical protein